jgi:nicotinamidase-related amidase
MAHALAVVDVQNDFLPPDGALAVPAEDEVIEPINALLAGGGFDLVVATRDWHPPDHASFISQGALGPRTAYATRLGLRSAARSIRGPSTSSSTRARRTTRRVTRLSNRRSCAS